MQILRLGLFLLIIMVLPSLKVFSTHTPSPSLDSDAAIKGEKVERVLIHLNNVSFGNQSVPGSNGIVKLEHRRFKQESQTLDAMAGFYDVPANKGYTITGLHQTSSKAFDNATELWGIWNDVEISPLQNEFFFVRNMPYLFDVKVSYQRDNIANPSLQKGDVLEFDIQLRNPSSESFRTSVVLLLKNTQSGEIIRLEKDVSLQANQNQTNINYSYIAESAGEFYFAAGIFVKQRFNQWTDCWDWSENPMFFVSKEHRTLDFSGYTWDVKAGYGNPGGNLWSNDSADVWIDDRERLHLTLAPKSNNRWYATEVISQETFGYGTFTFFLDADPEAYDPHVVAGIFLYMNESNEIDIEFSRWGDKENYQFGNFVIQPADIPGNHFRFPILATGTYTTHRIVWKPEEILFSSWHGHYDDAPEGRIIAQWQYAGSNIPVANGLRLFFNLWLFNGITPKSDTPENLIIAGFIYEPLVTPSISPSNPE